MIVRESCAQDVIVILMGSDIGVFSIVVTIFRSETEVFFNSLLRT